jgi:hypothetical protein
MIYFSTQISTNKNSDELYQSLYGLLRGKENDYFCVYPFCFFDSEYYKNLDKKIKSPYYGEIKNDEFTFQRTIFLHYFRQLKIVGKIHCEIESTSLRLNFQMSTLTVIAYLVFLVFGIWQYVGNNEPIILIFPIFLAIEYFIVLYNYVKIRKTITNTR